MSVDDVRRRAKPRRGRRSREWWPAAVRRPRLAKDEAEGDRTMAAAQQRERHVADVGLRPAAGGERVIREEYGDRSHGEPAAAIHQPIDHRLDVRPVAKDRPVATFPHARLAHLLVIRNPGWQRARVRRTRGAGTQPERHPGRIASNAASASALQRRVAAHVPRACGETPRSSSEREGPRPDSRDGRRDPARRARFPRRDWRARMAPPGRSSGRRRGPGCSLLPRRRRPRARALCERVGKRIDAAAETVSRVGRHERRVGLAIGQAARTSPRGGHPRCPSSARESSRRDLPLEPEPSVMTTTHGRTRSRK